MRYAFERGLEAAHRSQHQALVSIIGPLQHLLRVAEPQKQLLPPQEALRSLEKRFKELLETDFDRAKNGVYPVSLLFDIPVGQYVQKVPKLAREIMRTRRRRIRKGTREIPNFVNVTSYPTYFVQNFHWQSDGYLSRESAELYDVSVEFLFAGAADMMRRQALAPIAEFLSARTDTPSPRLLDVGCGTGRFLRQVWRTNPSVRVHGLDLSEPYLEKARETLRFLPADRMVKGNAESLPFEDGSFDIVTSIYMFHELPHRTRRQVVEEMRRALRPGGLVVIVDSAQLADGSDISYFLQRFPEDFHEPYYRDYLNDDLCELLKSHGFANVADQRAYVSRVVSARKLVAN